MHASSGFSQHGKSFKIFTQSLPLRDIFLPPPCKVGRISFRDAARVTAALCFHNWTKLGTFVSLLFVWLSLSPPPGFPSPRAASRSRLLLQCLTHHLARGGHCRNDGWMWKRVRHSPREGPALNKARLLVLRDPYLINFPSLCTSLFSIGEKWQQHTDWCPASEMRVHCWASVFPWFQP